MPSSSSADAQLARRRARAAAPAPPAALPRRHGVGQSTLIGNGRTSVAWPPATHREASRGRRAPRGRGRRCRGSCCSGTACGSRAGRCAEQAVEQLARCHGQMPNASGFGHGMCQKVTTVASGRRSLEQPRQQREVVVLHEHDRALGRRISSSTASANFSFTAWYASQSLGAERRARVGDVAERPEPLVGEARSSSPPPPPS